MIKNSKILDFASLFPPEFLTSFTKVLNNLPDFDGLVEIVDLYFAGAKGYGKSGSIIMLMIILMIINPNVSGLVIMETKTEQFDKTYSLFQRVIQYLSTMIPQFDKLFEYYISESRMRIVLNNGSGKQEIIFSNLENLNSGGATPPLNTAFLGYLYDDAVVKTTSNNTTGDKEENILSSLRNGKQSTKRYLKDFGFKDHICFHTQNNFAGNSPLNRLLEKNLPDDYEKQLTLLFNDYLNKEEKIYFFKGALEMSPFATQSEIDGVDRDILNGDEYLTEKYGLTSYGRDSVLGYLSSKIAKNSNRYKKQDFIPFSIGIDVGGFGHASAKTVMSLIGGHPFENFFTVLEEKVYNPKTSRKMTPNEIARDFLFTIEQGEMIYPLLARPTGTNEIEIGIDPSDSNHSYFKELLETEYRLMMNIPEIAMNEQLKPIRMFSAIKINLANFKGDKEGDGVVRSYQGETMIGRSFFKPIKEGTPELYKELMLMKIVNGRRNDNDLDCIQSVEYGLGTVMRGMVTRTVQDITVELSKGIGNTYSDIQQQGQS